MSRLPIVFHPTYDVKVDGRSRFPIQKYRNLKQLLEEDKILRKDNLFLPVSLAPSDIYITHDRFYVDRVENFFLLTLNHIHER